MLHLSKKKKKSVFLLWLCLKDNSYKAIAAASDLKPAIVCKIICAYLKNDKRKLGRAKPTYYEALKLQQLR